MLKARQKKILITLVMLSFKKHAGFSSLQGALKCARDMFWSNETCLPFSAAPPGLPLSGRGARGQGGPLPGQSACPQFLPLPATACSQHLHYMDEQQPHDRQTTRNSPFIQRDSSDLKQLRTSGGRAQDAQTEPWNILLWGFCYKNHNKWISEQSLCIYTQVSSFI